MKSYWIYRTLFFGSIVLSILLVMATVSSRERSAGRAEASTRTRAVIAPRPREPSPNQLAAARDNNPIPLSSRVRITTVVPYRREIELFNFGDAAEDLTGWQLTSPRAGGDDAYTFPIGTVLLPEESLVVVVDDGVDRPGELYWRAGGDRRVLDLSSDTVTLIDDEQNEVSRFSYLRR